MRVVASVERYGPSVSRFAVEGSVKKITVREIHYCCDEMKEAIDERFIVFGEYDDCGLNINGNINITTCHPYPEGAAWDEMSIRHCPFCAEKINISLIDS